MTHLSPDVKGKVGKKEISPIVWQRQPGQSLDDWKPGDGVRPYKPLELAGREIYIREGCYLCHSQMIRPFRDEKDRYGHYSVSSESMYDHPFQWGSKRTGPDLARVGGKYSDEWHRRHLKYPRDVVPESVMPNYVFLENRKVDAAKVKKTMEAMNSMPFYPANYTKAEIESAVGVEGKTELEALIAYLQSLGNHIKFTEGVNYRD
jgi:cytochrome c oxidase cbb3-type subunit 2